MASAGGDAMQVAAGYRLDSLEVEPSQLAPRIARVTTPQKVNVPAVLLPVTITEMIAAGRLKKISPNMGSS
jgi:hypothetical protein